MVGQTKDDMCYPDLDVKKYDQRVWQFKQKPFLAVNVLQLFHVPINLKATIKYASEQIEKHSLGASSPQMMLYGMEGLFWGKVLFEVQKPHPDDKQNVFLSGTFLSKSYVGAYSGLSSALSELSELCKKKFSKTPTEFFFWYVSCKKCSGTDSNLKTIVFAKIE
ncbi:MAG: hypothetical protein QXW70_00250 [Candidatus Anstonellales archaeon]